MEYFDCYISNIFHVVIYKIVSTAQKTMFPIKDFFSKCNQILSFLWIWSNLLKELAQPWSQKRDPSTCLMVWSNSLIMYILVLFHVLTSSSSRKKTNQTPHKYVKAWNGTSATYLNRNKCERKFGLLTKRIDLNLVILKKVSNYNYNKVTINKEDDRQWTKDCSLVALFEVILSFVCFFVFLWYPCSLAWRKDFFENSFFRIRCT